MLGNNLGWWAAGKWRSEGGGFGIRFGVAVAELVLVVRVIENFVRCVQTEVGFTAKVNEPGGPKNFAPPIF